MAQNVEELVALINAGHHAEAERLACILVETAPNDGFIWRILAAAIARQGRIEESLAPIQRAVELAPTYAEAHNELGDTLKKLGRLEEAERSFRDALHLKPDFAAAHGNLGVTLDDLGRLSEAEQSYRSALKIAPNNASVHYNLGNTLRDLGRLDDAEASYRTTLEIRPDFADAHCNLGIVLKALGRLSEAEGSFRNALEVKPDFDKALCNLGPVLESLDRLSEAQECYQRALKITPNYAKAHGNLGIVLKNLGRFAEAEVSLRRALEIEPRFTEAYSNLGGVLHDLGRHAEAETCYLRALEIQPDCLEAHDNLLFSLCYHPRHNPSELHEKACDYGQTVGNLVTRRFPGRDSVARPQRLRVGLVSGDLRDHPVGFFLEGMLSKIDRSSLELIAYPTFHRVTELTGRLRTHFSAWRPLFGLSDKAAAALIHSDRVDILIDLSGHTAHNRLPMFAWKPAPIQVTWLGYWATTGVQEIDYILVDETGVPPGQESEFTEKPWYLPHTRLCFTPPEGAPKVASLPALGAPEMEVVFGCCQILSKVNDDTLSLWGRVFTALPGSRLRWQCKQFDDPAVVRSTLERLAGFGIDPSRVKLPGRTPRDRYLAAYAEVDIVLDTFPFPGGTTTCEALWMGVPTLTLAGESMLSRQGASLLSAAGLPEWIAASENDFVVKAVSLAGNREALVGLAQLRSGLRERVAASPLFDVELFAGHFEEALWGMWDRRQADRNSTATAMAIPRTDIPAADANGTRAEIPVLEVAPETVRTFLQIGCGPKRTERGIGVFPGGKWQELRIDDDPAVAPAADGTMFDLSAVGNRSVDAVFSSHHLKHLYPHEVPLALAEFKRVLKPDGVLIVTCPDLQSVCALIAQDKLADQAYLSPAGPIAPLDLLYGHRPSLAKGNLLLAHRCGFTEKTLTSTLKAAGFSSVASAKRGHPFFDLWTLATLDRRSEQDLLILAADHFPE